MPNEPCGDSTCIDRGELHYMVGLLKGSLDYLTCDGCAFKVSADRGYCESGLCGRKQHRESIEEFLEKCVRGRYQ